MKEVKKYLSEIGAVGGKSKSPKKLAAIAKNGLAPCKNGKRRGRPAGSGARLSVLTEEKVPVSGRAKHLTKHYAHDPKTGELITSSFQLRAVFAVLRAKGYSARDWITPQNTEAREPEPSAHDRRTGAESGSL